MTDKLVERLRKHEPLFPGNIGVGGNVANEAADRLIELREMLERVMRIGELLAGDVPVSRDTWRTLREAKTLLEKDS